MLYRHKEGYYLRFIRKTESTLNWFMIVDKDNKPILCSMPYFTKEREQLVIIDGFDNLTLIDNNTQLTLF